MAEMIGSLVGLFLVVLGAGFCLGAMAVKVGRKPRREDYDIETILANAERPHYTSVP